MVFIKGILNHCLKFTKIFCEQVNFSKQTSANNKFMGR